jgi:hypothetical protein
VDSIARTISKEFNNVENTTQGGFVPNSDIRPVLVRVRPANGFGLAYVRIAGLTLVVVLLIQKRGGKPPS